MATKIVKDPIRVCVEKLVPKTGLELAMTHFWPQNKTLRVRFLGGDPRVHKKVIEQAVKWHPYSNVTFSFGNDPDAEIRVAFVRDGTSWSAVGTDALNKRYFPKETMNFGWLTPKTDEEEYSRVVIHEFGHALGCIHEHQSPAAGAIPWNKEKVYAYYERTQHWSKETVDQNLFVKTAMKQSQYSRFDPHSIMLYPIPKELTDGVFEVGWNCELSDMDKKFMSQKYPKRKAKAQRASE